LRRAACVHRDLQLNLFSKLDIRSVERGICPIAALYLLRLWPFGSHDVIGHVAIGLATYGFL